MSSMIVVINILIAFSMSLGGAPLLVWMERRIAGLVQDRMGPNRCHIAGFRLGGIIQSIADMLKLAFKEDYISKHIKQRFIFELAPIIVFVCSFLSFMVIPFADDLLIDGVSYKMQAMPISFGLLWFLALTGLSVYGIMLGGWASGNKYSLLGSLRASAQMISYEASLILSVISLLLVYGSVDLNDIVVYQGRLIFGFIPSWGVVVQPLACVIFIITAFAETNRAPFDMAEGESEIVGFHVEYSAMKFGLFFVGEYVAMCASSAVIVTLFFGGYQIPWLDTESLSLHVKTIVVLGAILLPLMTYLFIKWMQKANHWIGDDARAKETRSLGIFLIGFVVFLEICLIAAIFVSLSENQTNVLVAILQILSFAIKVFVMNFIFILVRWTLPRFRYDQLQYLGWKILLPLALANIFITALGVVIL